MRRHIVTRHFALTIALCLSSSVFAHADVLICRNAGGAITYTNDQCPDDSYPDEVVSEKETSHAIKPGNPAMLRTRWAEPIPHRHNNPDVETIRSAHIAIELMDQDRLERRLRLATRD